MHDKAQLGDRYTCYECGTKFYDLNRPAALCPECNADQADAPVRDVKALLSSGRRRKAPKEEPKPEVKTPDEYDEDADAEEEEDDELEELDVPE